MDLDVAIIGASTAGLFAAELLARGGRRVAVFERRRAPTVPRRTYIITPRLNDLLGELPPAIVQHATDVMEVWTRGERSHVAFRKPDLIVERGALIAHLAERAATAGAAIHYGYRLTGIERRRERASLQFATPDGGDLTIRPGAIVGADGLLSAVRVAAGMAAPPAVAILQVEAAMPRGWDPSVSRVWFDTDDGRYFYWLIPESAERCAVGYIADDMRQDRVVFERFLHRHGLRPLAYQAARVAMHHPRLSPRGSIGATPVHLVGDAAGQVKVTTVGGTVTGLWGARAAAEAILGRPEAARTARELKRELDVHWLIRAAIERLDNADYDWLVRQLTPGIRDLLAATNRDEMAGVAWRIPLLRPQLLGLGVKLLRGPAHLPLKPRPTMAATRDSLPSPASD